MLFEDFNVKVTTSADTREKAIRAFGFDEPPVAEKLNRADFNSDEAYFDAVAQVAVRNSSPEYREAYRKARREYNAQKAAAAEKKHQQKIEQAIKACTLSEREQKAVDDEARSRAQADLAAGRISYPQLGEAVEKYAREGTETAKEKKVHTADLNQQIRAAMKAALRR